MTSRRKPGRLISLAETGALLPPEYPGKPA